MNHEHICLDCNRRWSCSNPDCILDEPEMVSYEHCGCVREREYKRQVALEKWARRLYEDDVDPEENYDEGPEKKEF